MFVWDQLYIIFEIAVHVDSSLVPVYRKMDSFFLLLSINNSTKLMTSAAGIKKHDNGEYWLEHDFLYSRCGFKSVFRPLDPCYFNINR